MYMKIKEILPSARITAILGVPSAPSSLLLAGYCFFGISGAAELMRVFQSEFIDTSQEFD